MNMALEYLYAHWKSVFIANGFTDDVAQEEYQTWCEGLGGELDNEFQQSEFSVCSAANEAVNELKQYT